VLNRWSNRHLSAAWNLWLESTRELVHQQMLLQRGMLRMLHAQVAGALSAWREQASDSKQKLLLARG